MKIRTDFVTNSSSSSYLTFSIKSKEMVEALEERGFRFELEKEDTITNDDTIITPDGEQIDIEYAIYEDEITVCKFDSGRTVFEWFLAMFGENDGDEYEDYADYDEYDEYEEYSDEESEAIKAIEKSIEECEIIGGEAVTDDDTSFCMHITVKNGKKTTAILTDEKWNDSCPDVCLGIALSDMDGFPDTFSDYADKYGDIKTEDL